MALTKYLDDLKRVISNNYTDQVKLTKILKMTDVVKDLSDITNLFLIQGLLIIVVIIITICTTWQVFKYMSTRKVMALYEAIDADNTQLALSLLDSELINQRLNNGYTPFLAACLRGNTILVKTMIRMGADKHALTDKNENAIYLAAFHCVCNIQSTDASCLHALYYSGVDINQPNEDDVNPVQMAAVFGHQRLVQWLLDKGADAKSLKDLAMQDQFNCSSWLSSMVKEHNERE